jgi:putative hemolysin
LNFLYKWDRLEGRLNPIEAPYRKEKKMATLLFYFIASHLASFVCSILEAVLLCSTGSYISLLKKKNPSAAEILKQLKMDISRPLAAILTINTGAHTFGAAGVGAQVVELFGSYWLGFASIILTLTMLLFTEMIPKTIGALYWKELAPFSAYFIKMLIVVTYPFVILFEGISKFLSRGAAHDNVTEDEIKHMLAEGARAGIFEEAEYDMVEGVLRLTNRRVGMLMTPRQDIKWLDIQLEQEKMKQSIEDISYSRFPVCNGSLDEVIGVLNTKKVLMEILKNRPLDIPALVHPPVFVPENMKVLQLIELFKKTSNPFALVTDEYGGIQGVVTIHDLLESIVGDLPTTNIPTNTKMAIYEREKGTWVVDGMLPIDEFKAYFGMEPLPDEEKGIYRTLSGFCMYQLGNIPSIGDVFIWNQSRYKIVKMSGRRIEKVLIQHLPK